MAKNSGGKRKSFKRAGGAPSVNKSNPTGGVMKNSGGFTGRATNPTEKPYTKKGNP
jgi:hypothetical protein